MLLASETREWIMKNGYRVSKYETVFPLPGDPSLAVAVNGLYGAMDILRAEESHILETSGSEAASLASLSEDTAKRLLSRGHLVRADEGWEEENLTILSRIHWLVPYRKFMDLVIMPTYNCNFRCEYCFERARLDRGREWLAHAMSEETLDGLFRQVDALRQRGVVIRKAILYGGEPLLRGNRDLVADILRRCSEREIHLAAVTNGYDLDRFIDLFPREWTDFLQITVDGPAPVHDSRRFLAGGQGTFERIMSNIRLALDHQIPVQVRTNVNRANLEDAIRLREEYAARGFLEDSRFHYYYKATLGAFEDEPGNAITDEEIYQALLAAGTDVKDAIAHCRVHLAMAQFASGAFSGESYPMLRPAFCGANADMLVVDPDGDLYACWNLVSMEEHAVGFLDAEKGRFLYNFNLARWRNRTVDHLPDCRECPLNMLCGGGCAVEAEATHGDRNRGYCGSMKEAFRDVIPTACEAEYRRTGRESLSESFYDLFRNVTPEERKTLLTSSESGEVWEILKRRLTRAEKIFA